MRKLFSLFLVLVLSLSLVCAGAEEAGNESEPMAGGWYTGADPDITDEIRQLVATGLEEFVGVEYTPVAYLGSQVVAGTNYAILCQGRAVVPDAEPYWVILYLYQDLEGKVSVLGIVNLDLGIINLDLAV